MAACKHCCDEDCDNVAQQSSEASHVITPAVYVMIHGYYTVLRRTISSIICMMMTGLMKRSLTACCDICCFLVLS